MRSFPSSAPRFRAQFTLRERKTGYSVTPMLRHNEHFEKSLRHGERQNRSTGTSRMSHISLRALFCMTMLLGGAAKATHDLQPVEQPSPSSSSGARFSRAIGADGPLPSPDDDPENIFQQLDSHESSGQFLKQHIKSVMPQFPFDFLNTYHAHPKTILQTRQTACNGLANWNAERLARRGIKSYTVSICPKHPVRALWNSWHQVQVVCIRRGERYLIFDNDEHFYCDGTLSSCLAQKHPNMMIVPLIGGNVPWHRTSETAIGGLSMHAQRNMDEMDMKEYPEFDELSICGDMTSAR